MQAQTAARFEDVLAHVTFTGAGGKDSRLVPLWDQTRVCSMGPGGLHVYMCMHMRMYM